MLTREEQEEILKRARKIVAYSKVLDTRTRRHEVSDKAAATLIANKWQEFKDFLKELG